MALEIDLFEYEQGKRHWLHPLEKYKHLIEAEREKFIKQETKDRRTQDAARPTLNQSLYIGNRLKADVRNKLLSDAEKFKEFLDVPNLKVEDVILTGSNASYNYTTDSDIDVHLLVDFTTLPFSSIADAYFLAEKKLWKDEYDARIHGIPIEFYVQNTKAANQLTANGVYSLTNNAWSKFPRSDLTYGDENAVDAKYNDYKHQIDTLLADNPTVKQIDDLGDSIYALRTTGLQKGGELSVENVTFKRLRSNGDLQRLDNEKRRVTNRSLSLDFDPNEKRDPTGKWTTGGGTAKKQPQQKQQTETFVSPNVEEHLSFEQAVKGLHSSDQKVLAAISHSIDDSLGIKDIRINHVIGAWADGAENSVMTNTASTDFDVEKAAAAAKGLLANQKSVLLFHPDENGHEFMAQFRIKNKDLADIHKQLLEDGIAFHTLEPRGSDIVVHVFGDNPELLEVVSKTAKKHNTTVEVHPGTGTFVGTHKEDGTDEEQRADAREQYAKTIEAVAATGKLPDKWRTQWANYIDNWERQTGRKVEVRTIGTTTAERPEGGTGRAGGTQGPESAQASAAKAASGHPRLEGLPDQPLKLGDNYYIPAPLKVAHDAAEKYMQSAGLEYDPPKQYKPVDEALATRIAKAFDEMKHDPENPEVKAAYKALAEETMAQWKVIKETTGLKVEWITSDNDPYVEKLDLIRRDVRENNHIWEFPTDLGYGSGDPTERHNNPMLQMTDEVIDGKKCTVNDIFRIVHDYFGHFKDDVGFTDDGEENAWRSHAAMYSPLARRAATTETRGQASWVNHGPYGEANRTAEPADIHYAPQKIGLLPEWASDEGRKDTKDADFIETQHPRAEGGQFTTGSGKKFNKPTYKPGEAPIPKGMVRRFHYTRPEHVQPILKHGLKMEHSTGVANKDPVAIWSNPVFAGYDKPTIEFWDDPKNYANNPIARIGDVPPEQIIAVHEPWHQAYRSVKERNIPIKNLRRIGNTELVVGGGMTHGELADYLEHENNVKAFDPGKSGEWVSAAGSGGNPPNPKDPQRKKIGDKYWKFFHIHTTDGMLNFFLNNNRTTDEFDPAEHPTAPEGAPGGTGGQFVKKGTGTAGTTTKPTKTKTPKKAEEPATRPDVTKPLTESNGHTGIVSSAKHKDEGKYYQPSLKLMQTDQEQFDYNIGIHKNPNAYPLQDKQLQGDSNTVARNIIDHIKSNLKFIYDNTPEETRNRTKQWYDGAHKLVEEHVAKYKGIKDTTVAGLYACLSPSNLWDQNVRQADQMIDIYYNHRTEPWTDDMSKVVHEVYESPLLKKLSKRIEGKKYAQLKTAAEKGLWIRTYDQAHNKTAIWKHDGEEEKLDYQPFHSITPEGERHEWFLNPGEGTLKAGRPQGFAWQTPDNMAKAVNILESDGDRNVISDNIGKAHKVRSFYNNILDPNSTNGDVTIDTHAVDASWLKDSPVAVFHNFGSTMPTGKQAAHGWLKGAHNSIVTGAKGTYGLYAQAYRELAKDLKLQPRQLQSIIWETKRAWMGDMDDFWNGQVAAEWDKFRTGSQSQADTQKKVKTIIDKYLKEPRANLLKRREEAKKAKFAEKKKLVAMMVPPKLPAH